MILPVARFSGSIVIIWCDRSKASLSWLGTPAEGDRAERTIEAKASEVNGAGDETKIPYPNYRLENFLEFSSEI
jgi:hypothetical protein